MRTEFGLWWTIKHWIKRRWYRFTYFFTKLNRAFFWARYSWNNHDWDFGYALDMFYTKTVRVRKGIEKYKHHVYYERDVRRMKEFESILKRLINEDYEMQVYKEGEWGMTFGEPDEMGCIPIGTTSPPVKDCVMFEVPSKEYYEHCKMLREQDCEFVGLYLAKYSESWWD